MHQYSWGIYPDHLWFLWEARAFLCCSRSTKRNSCVSVHFKISESDAQFYKLFHMTGPLTCGGINIILVKTFTVLVVFLNFATHNSLLALSIKVSPVRGAHQFWAKCITKYWNKLLTFGSIWKLLWHSDFIWSSSTGVAWVVNRLQTHWATFFFSSYAFQSCLPSKLQSTNKSYLADFISVLELSAASRAHHLALWFRCLFAL